MRSASAAWDSPALIRSRCTFRPTIRRTSSDMGASVQAVQLIATHYNARSLLVGGTMRTFRYKAAFGVQRSRHCTSPGVQHSRSNNGIGKVQLNRTLRWTRDNAKPKPLVLLASLCCRQHLSSIPVCEVKVGSCVRRYHFPDWRLIRS